MKLALILYKYFPYGGLQRDFMRIAECAVARGHHVDVYALEWYGDKSARMSIQVGPDKGVTNHRRYLNFYNHVQKKLKERCYDCVLGFNKMPGLDVYYAADPCFIEKLEQRRFYPLHRLSPRYRCLENFEAATFDPTAKTQILYLSDIQKQHFTQHYVKAEADFHLLPPSISSDRFPGSDAVQVRQRKRNNLGVKDDELLVLTVGSGFKTKGLDRSLHALAALPEELKQRVKFIAIGQDNPSAFLRLAKSLKVDKQFRWLPGQKDIPAFLQAADLLLHPAYYETAGIILLEAIVAGLPVLTTQTCGYAQHVEQAQAGKVLGSPFSQVELNTSLSEMLTSSQRDTWKQNGIAYGQSDVLADMPAMVVDFLEQQYTAGGG